MNFKTTIIVEDPPYKFVKYNRRKDEYTTYYLSGNLFFNRNVWTVNSIVQECKRYLKPFFEDLPKLEKMQLEMIFERNTTQFDLDNKGYFWEKVFFDLLKTPTMKQINNSALKGRDIVTVNVLHDDTVRFVDKITKSFVKGGNRITFIIEGKLLDEQSELF